MVEYRKEEMHEEGSEETTPDQLVKSAKNKFGTLVENGKWNPPTADEEKIVALEAKLTSMIKNIDKKVKFELNKGKNKGQNKPVMSRTERREPSPNKVERTTIRRPGHLRNLARRRPESTKATSGTGAEKTLAANARSGAPTTLINARALLLPTPVIKRESVQPTRRRKVLWRKSCASLARTSLSTSSDSDGDSEAATMMTRRRTKLIDS